MIEFKRCPRCGKTKHLSEFNRNRSEADGMSCYCKLCAAENQRKYPGSAHAASIRWVKKNRERVNAANAKWRRDHPERARAARLGWRNSHRDSCSAIEQKRRAKKAGNGGSYTAAEWRALKEYYHHRCLCCGRDGVKLTADHVLPVSLGGTSDISNIQPLCRQCNSRKYTKHVDYRSNQ